MIPNYPLTITLDPKLGQPKRKPNVPNPVNYFFAAYFDPRERCKRMWSRKAPAAEPVSPHEARGASYEASGL